MLTALNMIWNTTLPNMYATVTTGEDFAEVFWLYLKSKGKLHRFYDTAPIRRKWKFVGELGKR